MEPTEEEIRRHPELEYTNEEVKKVVAGMTKEQQIQFREFEQYFLTRYRQTGNIRPLSHEICSIVKEMCPSMPGQLQEVVIEVRAQLLAEAKLKELCKQLNIPLPIVPTPPVIHPIDEALLGEKASPMESVEKGTDESVAIIAATQKSYGIGRSRAIQEDWASANKDQR